MTVQQLADRLAALATAGHGARPVHTLGHNGFCAVEDVDADPDAYGSIIVQTT
jgi:hypothetical protein